MYITSLPLSNAFAFTPTVTIPVALSVALTLVVMAGFRYPRRTLWTAVDPPILLFGGIIFLSLLVNAGSLDQKALGHTLSWAVCLGLMYYVPRLCLFRHGVQSALGAVTTLFFVVACFVLIEWTAKNILQYDFDSLIPRPQGSQYFANALTVFQRARGLASESGLAGLFFASLMPIVNITLWEHSASARTKGAFIASIILTGLCIFSTTYFIAIALYGAIKFATARRTRIKYALMGITVVTFIGFWDVLSKLAYVLVASKFEMSSAEIRFTNFTDNLTVILQSGVVHLAVGYGPGSYGRLGLSDAAPSVFANIIRDLGVSGFCAFLLIFLSVVYQVSRAPRRRRIDLGASLFIILLFMQSNMEYYQPVIWFVLALVWGLSRNSRGAESNEPIYTAKGSPFMFNVSE